VNAPGALPSTGQGSPLPVLIFAPLGRDAELLRDALATADIEALAVREAGSFQEGLARGAGAILLTQEAVRSARPALASFLPGQPEWSDLPLVLLLSPAAARAGHLRTDLLLAANATVLERPVRIPTLLSVVRAALRARARQHEVRDLLGELHRLNAGLEERVRARTRQARDLAQALTLAEQRERQHLSELLHDHLQQLLFGVQIKLELATQAEERDVYRPLLSQAQDLVQEAMTLTRTLSVDLHPPILAGDGLALALEWVANQMREQYGLEVELQAEGPCPVPSEEILILLTRSVRELLFNVVKHAGVTRARVHLQELEGRLRVTVEDEGSGYDPKALAARRLQGGGLSGLRERLRLLGGEMRTVSEPGRGVRTTLEVALRD
jgi:signal transduction histidine kinase